MKRKWREEKRRELQASTPTERKVLLLIINRILPGKTKEV
jgi:hypothetical protein